MGGHREGGGRREEKGLQLYSSAFLKAHNKWKCDFGGGSGGGRAGNQPGCADGI